MSNKKIDLMKWSYSRWSKYHDCPSMYEWQYILKKVNFVKTPAMIRGEDIHKKAENYVNGKIKGLPKELNNFSQEFQNLRREFKKGNGFCEPDISTNIDGTPATRKTTNYFIGFADFFHKPVDVIPTVIDYKTGKQYPSHQSQGHAYSTFILFQNPSFEAIDVEFWYLDDPRSQTNVKHFYFKQKELPKMLALWDKRITTMYNDTKFKKTPYQWCNSCPRHKNNGGDCNG